MKKMRKILALVMVCALFCSVFCVGASAASTSTYLSLTGSSGTYYYIKYSDSSYYVGYGWDNNTKPVKVVQASCYVARTFSSNTLSQIDGVFGSGTYTAICGYQGKYGLTVDGGVGANTWKAMGYTHYQSSISYYL